MYEITFYVFCRVLNREFRNVEMHRSMADARLRAYALNWTIETVKFFQTIPVDSQAN